jgi:hypothetical protein
VELEYDSLNQRLWDRFPVLKEPRYTQLIGGIDAGPYVVFGVVVNRYLADLATMSDVQAEGNIATFIEEMATADDDRVVDLLTTEVLPTLLGTQAMVDAYWPLLGTATRRRLWLLPPRFARNVEFPAST